MADNKPIITRYRPEAFDEVLGHTAQIAALQRVINSTSTPHSFLFTGPSGTGKTTLARIVGSALKADVHEIDAASNNGVDAMRDLVEFSQHQAFTETGKRLIIIDECFVKGTRVNTPNGYQTIETLHSGDWIIGATGSQQIKQTICNKVPLTHIMQLHLANGRTILCSDDHAFLTESGWIAAQDTANVKSIQTIHKHIPRDLLAMWDCNYEQMRRKATLSRMCSTNLPRVRNKILEQYTSTIQANHIGSEERQMPSKFRVESVTYLQQTDIERLRQNGETCFINDIEHAICYDLEIEGHPSYAVEDLIVHNCHTLSKPAWQAILKLLEDPPEHMYLALCTTEDDKVPDTVRTRCFSTRLMPIAQQTIVEVLETIAEVEEWRPSQEILDYSAEASNGSPRFALTILQSIHDAPSREEAARIVRLLEPTSDLIDILRHLLDGKRSWVVISKHLKALDGLNFDEVSIQAGRYLSAALLRSETEEKAKPIWAMLEALVFPAETFDRKVAFIAAIGRILWGS